ncbi:MAG: rod shape-determining protein MreC [Clostridia bacterium]
MKGFIKSNTFKILLMVIVICLSILLLSQTAGSVSLASVFGLVTNPMTDVTSTLSADELQKYDDMDYDELIAYIVDLESENAQLTEQLVDYYNIKTENLQYQSMLNILDEYTNLELVASSVTAKDSTDPFDGFTIDVGYNDGVNLNDSVITEQGLVGIISEVDANYSKVTTILSEDVSVGACAKELGESGVIAGYAEGAINSYVKLNYLTVDTNIKQGDLITTSGTSEIFAEDLVIGTVISVNSSLEDVSFYAIVETNVDMENLTYVYVVTDFYTVTQETENETITDEEILQEEE